MTKEELKVTQGASSASSTGGFGSDFFNGIKGGNAALAMVLVNQIMQLYMELMNLKLKVFQTELQVQKDSAVATATAVKNADLDQAYGQIAQGTLQIVGSGASFAAGFKGRSANKDLNSQIDSLDNDSKSLRSLNKTVQGVTAKGTNESGIRPDEMELQEIASGGNVNSRIEELKQGNFAKATDDDAKAFAQLKATSPEEYNQVRKNIETQLKLKESEISKLQSQYSNSVGQYDQNGRNLSELFQGIGQGIAGGFQLDKATQDMRAEFGRVNSAQAATAISEALRGISEEYQKAVQELQILQKIQEASRVGY